MKRKVLIIAGLCLLLVGCGSQPKGASVSESKDTTTIEENSIVDTASGVVEDSQTAEALEDTQKSEVAEEPAKVHYTDDEGFSCNFHININGIEVELNGDELMIRDKTYTGITEYEAKMLKNTFKAYRNASGNHAETEAKGEVLRVAESIAENHMNNVNEKLESSDLTDWKQTYADYFLNYSGGEITGYDIYDVNNDGIPEIFGSSGGVYPHLFYINASGEVEELGLGAHASILDSGRISSESTGGGEQYDSVYLYNDATKKFELIFEGYALKVELYVWMFLSTVE